MKILHVINHIGKNSGAAKLLVDICYSQIRRGCKVDIVSLVSYEPSYVPILKELDLTCFTLYNKQINRYNPLSIFKLVPLIRKYDIVHVHLFPALYWVALAKLLSFSSCKLVYTEHVTLNNRQGKLWLYPLERFIYNRYDALVAISEAVSMHLMKLVPLSKIKVIYNGIDVAKYKNAVASSLHSLSIPDDKIRIVQVARFSPQKNPITVINALKLLPDNYVALFIGDGPLLPLHKQKVKDLHLENRVYFFGLRQDVPSILKIADVVVLSTNFEGFGLAAVEGMAAGKPVITSDVPGLREVVEGAGLLFRPHDEKELASLILRLMSDKGYYTKIAMKCQKRSASYDMEIMSAQYYQLYIHVLNK